MWFVGLVGSTDTESRTAVQLTSQLPGRTVKFVATSIMLSSIGPVRSDRIRFTICALSILITCTSSKFRRTTRTDRTRP